jgi:nicotinamidase/pyrazinamidase
MANLRPAGMGVKSQNSRLLLRFFLFTFHFSTMHRLLFWDVDSQQDFLKPGGALPVPGGDGIIPLLGELTRYARAKGIRIIASADDHSPDDRELSDHPDFTETFPPHCLRGSPGQARIPETTLNDPLVIEPNRSGADPAQVGAHAGDILIHKHWFDVFSNPNLIGVLRALDPEVIVLYGVAVDLAVRHTIEGLARHRPHTRLYLVVDATRSIRPELGEHLLKEWAEEGVRLVRSSEILEDGILDRYLNA